MAAANRVSNLNLYSNEDKLDDTKRFSVEVTSSDVQFEGSQAGKFDFESYQFKEGATYFNLASRFSALETDSTGSDNAAAITQLQADLASETVARTAADTTLTNSVSAEVSARASGDQALQQALDTQEAKQESDRAASDAAIAQEAVDRAASVSAEEARAMAAESALSTRIDNVISNADPASLDSLSELLTAYQAADSSLGDSIADAISRIQALEDKISELTDDV